MSAAAMILVSLFAFNLVACASTRTLSATRDTASAATDVRPDRVTVQAVASARMTNFELQDEARSKILKRFEWTEMPQLLRLAEQSHCAAISLASLTLAPKDERFAVNITTILNAAVASGGDARPAKSVRGLVLTSRATLDGPATALVKTSPLSISVGATITGVVATLDAGASYRTVNWDLTLYPVDYPKPIARVTIAGQYCSLAQAVSAMAASLPEFSADRQ